MTRLVKGMILLTLACLLSACGFHFRSSAEIPTSLKHLALVAPSNTLAFNSQLQDWLNSLDVKVENDTSKAPLTLNIISVKFYHNTPTSIVTSEPVSLSFSYAVSYSLLSRSGKIVLPATSVSASQTATVLMSNTVSSGPVSLIRSELRRQVIDELLYKLTATENLTKIQHYLDNPHEAQPRAVKHAA